MLMFGKKKKISEYLLKKQNTQSISPFDTLLSDYISGNLKAKLSQLDMKQIEIHIDWLPEFKCIGILGKVFDFYFDIQIEQDSYSIAYDKDEPDDAKEYSLQSSKLFYQTIEKIILNISK